jgi:hypothetical protein
MATAAAILALGAGLAFSHSATAAPLNPDRAALARQLAGAEDDFANEAFEQVVQTLGPTVESEAFGLLPDEVQYEALGLYARSLYRLGAFADAHEAFIGLTANPNATPADWAFRADTAERVGDEDDAELAQEELADSGDDGADSVAA